MKTLQTTLPLWVRAILLAGVFCIIAGAALTTYRFYEQPKTLTVAVGSFDGAARQIASIIAGRLASTDFPVRFKVDDSGTGSMRPRPSPPAPPISRWCGPMSAISRRVEPSLSTPTAL